LDRPAPLRFDDQFGRGHRSGRRGNPPCSRIGDPGEALTRFSDFEHAQEVRGKARCVTAGGGHHSSPNLVGGQRTVIAQLSRSLEPELVGNGRQEDVSSAARSCSTSDRRSGRLLVDGVTASRHEPRLESEAGLCGARDGRFKSNFGLKSRRLGANAPVSSKFRFFHYSCVFSIADRLRRAPLDHCHRGYVQRRHGGAGHLGRQR